MCTPKRFGDASTSHRMLWPLLDVRSNVTMGTKAPLLSWSMLKTEKPDCLIAFDKDPRPAKISTNKGGSEFCIGGARGSGLQSVWLPR